MKYVVGIYADSPRSGKSTLATALCQTGFVRYKFAGTLKEMLVPFMATLGIESPWDYLEGDLRSVPLPAISTPDHPITVRKLMQTLGTEWGREAVREDLWLRVLVNRIQRENPEKVVVDDLRFPNEAQALRALPCEVVLVRVARNRVVEPEAIHHASEGSLNDYPFDYTILNEGSPEDYRLLVNSFCSMFNS